MLLAIGLVPEFLTFDCNWALFRSISVLNTGSSSKVLSKFLTIEQGGG